MVFSGDFASFNKNIKLKNMKDITFNVNKNIINNNITKEKSR